MMLSFDGKNVPGLQLGGRTNGLERVEGPDALKRGQTWCVTFCDMTAPSC